MNLSELYVNILLRNNIPYESIQPGQAVAVLDSEAIRILQIKTISQENSHYLAKTSSPMRFSRSGSVDLEDIVEVKLGEYPIKLLTKTEAKAIRKAVYE